MGIFIVYPTFSYLVDRFPIRQSKIPCRKVLAFLQKANDSLNARCFTAIVGSYQNCLLLSKVKGTILQLTKILYMYFWYPHYILFTIVLSISPLQRPHYFTSSYTYKFFAKSYSCIVLQKISCTRQFESQLSLRSFAHSLGWKIGYPLYLSQSITQKGLP